MNLLDVNYKWVLRSESNRTVILLVKPLTSAKHRR